MLSTAKNWADAAGVGGKPEDSIATSNTVASQKRGIFYTLAQLLCEK